MASFVRRHRKPLLILLMLVPSILFASSYAAGAASGGRTEHFAQSPGDWSVSVAVSHPSYVVSGEQVAVALTVGVQDSNSNFTIGVNDVGVGVRQPLAINTTSGVVGNWEVLSTSTVKVNQNFSTSDTVQRVIMLGVASPPSNGPADLFVPSGAVAFDGFADITVYQQAGNVTYASPQTVSLIDSVTYYQSQLSTVASASSWVTYQLLAALVVAVLIIRTRPPPLNAAASPYSLEMKRFKAARMLARLGELRKSGRIGQARYDELTAGLRKDLGEPEGPTTS
ncbi:MAG: hypothetical protein KGI38_11075 [Thaumarchaeota archaeon]|nr:hypothetical protein [Nitrososphaerota archaeon]